ncbi:MAG: hypothetical protein WB566_20280, partial [Terriglobales bacterium]
IYDCPDAREGLNAEDDLKNFRRSMAMQATAEQRAAFGKISQYTEAAGDQLKDFQEFLAKVSGSASLADHKLAGRASDEHAWSDHALSDPALADHEAALDQAIEKVRAGNQNFLSSLSEAQKSGLKDIIAKLAREDSELDKQIKILDRLVHAPKPDGAEIDNSAGSLEKELASFQSEQLALGGQMSIVFPVAGEDVTFTLPPVTNSIQISGQPVSIPASGALLARPAAEAGHKLFSLKLVADLSDLQQNITAILRPEVTRSPDCGERIELQQADLTPLAPASLVVADLHFERWVCMPGQSPVDVAEGEGTLEVKLTPSIEPDMRLKLTSEITRVQAEGFLREMLRSGDLGAMLRDQIAAVLVSALQEGVGRKSTLPAAAQDSVTLEKAQFADTGAEQLALILDGQLQLSDEQTNLLSIQLKQRTTAQGASPP